jgi:hypothetical protein
VVECELDPLCLATTDGALSSVRIKDGVHISTQYLDHGITDILHPAGEAAKERHSVIRRAV